MVNETNFSSGNTNQRDFRSGNYRKVASNDRKHVLSPNHSSVTHSQDSNTTLRNSFYYTNPTSSVNTQSGPNNNSVTGPSTYDSRNPMESISGVPVGGGTTLLNYPVNRTNLNCPDPTTIPSSNIDSPNPTSLYSLNPNLASLPDPTLLRPNQSQLPGFVSRMPCHCATCYPYLLAQSYNMVPSPPNQMPPSGQSPSLSCATLMLPSQTMLNNYPNQPAGCYPQTNGSYYFYVGPDSDLQMSQMMMSQLSLDPSACGGHPGDADSLGTNLNSAKCLNSSEMSQAGELRIVTAYLTQTSLPDSVNLEIPASGSDAVACSITSSETRNCHGADYIPNGTNPTDTSLGNPCTTHTVVSSMGGGGGSSSSNSNITPNSIHPNQLTNNSWYVNYWNCNPFWYSPNQLNYVQPYCSTLPYPVSTLSPTGSSLNPEDYGGSTNFSPIPNLPDPTLTAGPNRQIYTGSESINPILPDFNFYSDPNLSQPYAKPNPSNLRKNVSMLPILNTKPYQTSGPGATASAVSSSSSVVAAAAAAAAASGPSKSVGPSSGNGPYYPIYAPYANANNFQLMLTNLLNTPRAASAITPNFLTNYRTSPDRASLPSGRRRLSGIYGNRPKMFDESEMPILNPRVNPTELDTSVFVRARYFVIKSDSEFNVRQAIKFGVWCSTRSGNQCLDEAYQSVCGPARISANPESTRNQSSSDTKYPDETSQESTAVSTSTNQFLPPGHVILFFSIRTLGHLTGVAEMTSPVNSSKCLSIWQDSRFRGEFSIRWLYVKNVPNQLFRHIQVESYDNRSVVVLRDTSEILPASKGEEMLRIVHEYGLSQPSNTTLSSSLTNSTTVISQSH